MSQKFISEDELRNATDFVTLNQAVLQVFPEDYKADLLTNINQQLLASKFNPDGVTTENFEVRFISDTADAGTVGGEADLELVLLNRTANKYLQSQVKLWSQSNGADHLAEDLKKLNAGTGGDVWQVAA